MTRRVGDQDTDVTISVVSGGDPALLGGFVQSLVTGMTDSYLLWHMVVVRNSTTALPKAELHTLGAHKVLERAKPSGFAANHNEIISDFPARYHLIANDDVIVEGQAVDRLVEFLEQPGNERVGVVSPKLLNFDGSLQPSTYAFPSLLRALIGMSGIRDRLGMGRLATMVAARLTPSPGSSRLWAHDREVDVATLKGAFTLVRRRCIDEVGLMDEVSLVGGEETEWHRRMAYARWRVVFWPSVTVLHKGSATVGPEREYEAEYLKGTLNYFFKHKPRHVLLSLRVLGTAIYGFRWISGVLSRRRDARLVARQCLWVLSRFRIEGSVAPTLAIMGSPVTLKEERNL